MLFVVTLKTANGLRFHREASSKGIGRRDEIKLIYGVCSSTESTSLGGASPKSKPQALFGAKVHGNDSDADWNLKFERCMVLIHNPIDFSLKVEQY